MKCWPFLDLLWIKDYMSLNKNSWQYSSILSFSSSCVQKGQVDMAKECLKMFFMKPPPHNQFLCRAYLCEAQLLAPPNADSPVSSLPDTNSQGSFLGPSENSVLVNSIPDSTFTAFESGSLLWYNTVNLYIIGLLLLKNWCVYNYYSDIFI